MPLLLAAEDGDPAAAAISGSDGRSSSRRFPCSPSRIGEVVTCRYLLDLDEAETATVLGWPRGTVKSRLHRALRGLSASLTKPGTVRDRCGRTEVGRDA